MLLQKFLSMSLLVASARSAVRIQGFSTSKCLSCEYNTWFGPASLGQCPRSYSSTPRRPSQKPATLQYSAAAAFSAKREPLNLKQNHFVYDSARALKESATQTEIRRPVKDRPKSGQDSFFISKIGNSSSLAFGVVDGVGGWEESGVDPADFAHSLCEHMAYGAANFPDHLADVSSQLDPVDLLEHGFERVMNDKTVGAGGSTACVGIASADGQITLANLGDSGFAHLTPFKLSFVSPAQTHAFNTPYQLAKLPAKMLAQIKMFSGPKPHSELPVDSAVTNHTLEHGDVLILATDGVWDNLFPEDLLRLTSKIMVDNKIWSDNADMHSVTSDIADLVYGGRTGEAAESSRNVAAMIASIITQEAKIAGLDRKKNGPFGKEVQRLYPHEHWEGGKLDDICTVVLIAIAK